MRALIFEHVAGEGPGRFGELLAGRGAAVETIRFDRGDAIPDPADFHLLLVMGGPMNVYEEDRYPFLRAEDRAIRRALASGVPYLGVCLGSQLLAKALGARVRANPVKEIGFDDVSLTPHATGDALLNGVDDPVPVFQWHGDTFELPSGATLLASSPACRQQAFRYGERAWGLQFHVEVSRAMVREWLGLYADELTETPGVDPRVILRDAETRVPALHRAAERIFENFLAVASGRG